MKYGHERLVSELQDLGYEVLQVTAEGADFCVLTAFIVPGGRFAERTLELALQAPADYPRTAPSAIHVKADPQLYEQVDSVHDVRNITVSVLGAEWRYWSHNFGWTTERGARHLMSQINGVFIHAQ